MICIINKLFLKNQFHEFLQNSRRNLIIEIFVKISNEVNSLVR